MVKREKEVKEKINAKGILSEINGQELIIVDPKSGDEDILSIAELDAFIGKEINFSFAQVIKEEKEAGETE